MRRSIQTDESSSNQPQGIARGHRPAAASTTDVLDLDYSRRRYFAARGDCVPALYRDGQRVRDIAIEEIGAFAGREGGIVWLGLTSSS